MSITWFLFSILIRLSFTIDCENHFDPKTNCTECIPLWSGSQCDRCKSPFEKIGDNCVDSRADSDDVLIVLLSVGVTLCCVCMFLVIPMFFALALKTDTCRRWLGKRKKEEVIKNAKFMYQVPQQLYFDVEEELDNFQDEKKIEKVSLLSSGEDN